MKGFGTTAAAFLAISALLSGEAAASRDFYEPPQPMTPDSGYLCGGSDQNSISIKSKIKVADKCRPGIPAACEAVARFHTRVDLVVDIDESGAPRNIRVAETSNDCFNQEAVNALAKSTFANKGEAAKDVKVRLKIVRHSNQYDRERLFDEFRKY